MQETAFNRSARRVFLSLILMVCAGSAAAQVLVRAIPHGACKGALLTNTSGKLLDVTLKYLYKGADNSYFSSSVAVGQMAPGADHTITLLPSHTVNCNKPYTFETAYTYRDLSALQRQEQDRAQGMARQQQQRERDEQMALARRLDENNRRAAEARREANLRHQQLMDERTRQIMADRQRAAARAQQYQGCPKNSTVSC